MDSFVLQVLEVGNADFAFLGAEEFVEQAQISSIVDGQT